MAGILQHIIDARCFEDAVANMLMHKLAYETTNKQEMRRKFREALPHLEGAQRLLAASLEPSHPNLQAVVRFVNECHEQLA